MQVLAAIGAVVLVLGATTEVEARGGGGSGGFYGRSSAALQQVGGYVTRRGTYVAPYVRTKADGIVTNNLSYRQPGRRTVAATGALPIAEAAAMEGSPASTAVDPSNSMPQSPCPKEKTVGKGAGFCLIN